MISVVAQWDKIKILSVPETQLFGTKHHNGDEKVDTLQRNTIVMSSSNFNETLGSKVEVACAMKDSWMFSIYKSCQM